MPPRRRADWRCLRRARDAARGYLAFPIARTDWSYSPLLHGWVVVGFEAVASGRAVPARFGRGALRVVADTGPLVAAANRRDEAHSLAATLVTQLGRDLLIPEPVIVEVDQLLRSRFGAHTARLFLAAIAAGEHMVVNLTSGLLRRAVELDVAFADLDLGYADAAVMAAAEREGLPVLTFDFGHFRATRPAHGFWQLVIDEHRYDRHVRR